MLTRSTRTRKDDQRKDHTYQKRPKQRNRPKQLQTHYMPTDDVGNINSTNKEIYFSQKTTDLFPGEQKGCRKGSRITWGLLYIDQHNLNESKTRRKNLAMAWIDYEKAYDMIPQILIINCLKMSKISDEVKNFIEKTMKTWKVELTAGRRRLAEAKVNRGIFQRDTLSPILLIITIMLLNHILRKCTAGYKLSKSQKI